MKKKIIKLREESVLKALYTGRNQQTKEQGVNSTNHNRLRMKSTPSIAAKKNGEGGRYDLDFLEQLTK